MFQGWAALKPTSRGTSEAGVCQHIWAHTHAGRYVGVIQRKVHTCEIMHVLCMNVGMHVCVNVGTHAGTHGYVDTGTD